MVYVDNYTYIAYYSILLYLRNDSISCGLTEYPFQNWGALATRFAYDTALHGPCSLRAATAVSACMITNIERLVKTRDACMPSEASVNA